MLTLLFILLIMAMLFCIYAAIQNERVYYYRQYMIDFVLYSLEPGKLDTNLEWYKKHEYKTMHKHAMLFHPFNFDNILIPGFVTKDFLEWKNGKN